MPLAWLGLYLSLNQNAIIREPLKPSVAAEATAIVAVGKITLTAIYIQPLQKPATPLYSVGVGLRLF
jgi:hypothetical protein